MNSSKLDWSEENELFPTFYRQFKYPKRTNKTASNAIELFDKGGWKGLYQLNLHDTNRLEMNNATELNV